MKIKLEIEELNARVDHLERRFDNLRDYVYERPDGEYLWNKFEDILALSMKYDKNSEEWSILNKAGWKIFELYLDWLFTKGINK